MVYCFYTIKQALRRTRMNSFLEQIHEATPFEPYIGLDYENFSYLPHYHEEIEILFVKSGKIIVTNNGKSTVLEENDIMVFTPFQLHEYVYTGKNALIIMKIAVPKNFNYHLADGKISTQNPIYPKVHQIITNIIQEYTQKTDGYTFAIMQYVAHFIALMIRELQTFHSDRQYKEKKDLQFFYTVNEYLENHYKEDISLDSISQHFLFSKYYFFHLFKKITSTTFGNYLTLFRLQKAKDELSQNKTITEAAFACGFNSLRSFNRNFKMHFGISPSEYVKLTKKK